MAAGSAIFNQHLSDGIAAKLSEVSFLFLLSCLNNVDIF